MSTAVRSEIQTHVENVLSSLYTVSKTVYNSITGMYSVVIHPVLYFIRHILDIFKALFCLGLRWLGEISISCFFHARNSPLAMNI